MRIVHVDHLKGVEGNGIENQLLSVDSSLEKLFESGSSETLDTETERTENETVYDSEETNVESEQIIQSKHASPKYSSRGRLIRPKCPFSA